MIEAPQSEEGSELMEDDEDLFEESRDREKPQCPEEANGFEGKFEFSFKIQKRIQWAYYLGVAPSPNGLASTDSVVCLQGSKYERVVAEETKCFKRVKHFSPRSVHCWVVSWDKFGMNFARFTIIPRSRCRSFSFCGAFIPQIKITFYVSAEANPYGNISQPCQLLLKTNLWKKYVCSSMKTKNSQRKTFRSSRTLRENIQIHSREYLEYFLGEMGETRGGALNAHTKIKIFLRYMADPSNFIRFISF
ncbi:hypothetical protein JTB14_004754 [Gonioctena quinquepunctata]|nr:hypothetical protein JTB14_004754 [Gonioctena quinquepunctata]